MNPHLQKFENRSHFTSCLNRTLTVLVYDAFRPRVTLSSLCAKHTQHEYWVLLTLQV